MNENESSAELITVLQRSLSKKQADTEAARKHLISLEEAGHGESADVLRGWARVLELEGDFSGAVQIWERFGQKFGMEVSDHVRHGHVLECLGRITEAIAAYRSFESNEKNKFVGAISESKIHATVQHHPAALRVLDDAVDRSVGSRREFSTRGMRAQRAMAAGRLLDALADYVAMERLKPRKADGLVGQTKVHLRNFDLLAARSTLHLAKQKFPGDIDVLSVEAAFVHQYGNEQEILDFCDNFIKARVSEETLDDVLSIGFGNRKNLFTTSLRNGIIASLGRAYEASLIEKILEPATPQAPAERLGTWLASIKRLRPPSGSPQAVRVRAKFAEALIANGRFKQALEQIDELRASAVHWPYTPPVMGTALEWQLARKGAFREAQLSYWARRRMNANRDRLHELEAVRLLPDPPPPVVVFCQLRNERILLPAFFRHYRSIGVRRFVMVDNGSSDGSFEYLLEQTDVELHRTNCPFRRAEAGNAWLKPLMARPAYADTLCLRVDADEHFVYPHYETKAVDDLWKFMIDEGADVIAGFMVDMLPEKLSDFDGDDVDIVAAARFFDPPPEPHPIPTSPYMKYVGGPRARLLDMDYVNLTKASGIRGGGKVEPLRISTHETSPARVSSVSMALLHYKFRPDFFDRAKRVAREHQYGNSAQEFALYQVLEDRREHALRSPTTVELNGSSSLLESGILRPSTAWDVRCREQADPPQGSRSALFMTWSNKGLVRNNWGDKLNPVLVELLTGRPVHHIDEAVDAPASAPVYSVIGSHLAKVGERHVVWGTGFINADDRIDAVPARICAVRGPLSRKMLLQQGIECPAVYGDPAVLLPLLYQPKVEISFDLGIILHIRDKGVADLSKMTGAARVVFIDIAGSIYDVIDQICSCSHIASSSLHGLIAAHAYGVPAS